MRGIEQGDKRHERKRAGDKRHEWKLKWRNFKVEECQINQTHFSRKF